MVATLSNAYIVTFADVGFLFFEVGDCFGMEGMAGAQRNVSMGEGSVKFQVPQTLLCKHLRTQKR